MKPSKRVLTIVVGLAIAVALVGGGYLLVQRFSPTEKALGELRAMPLVGLMMSDVPEAEKRLRAAIEQEARRPSGGGPTLPLQVVGELRREFIAPALRAADNRTAVNAMAARAKLVAHLQKTNPQACREFSLGGIQNVDRLDAEGQKLFRDVLSAIEAAYRSGRAGGKPLPVPAANEVGDWLREAGFQKSDFDKLNSFATLSNDVSCEMELKVNQAPSKMPAARQGPFSRFVLAN